MVWESGLRKKSPLRHLLFVTLSKPLSLTALCKTNTVLTYTGPTRSLKVGPLSCEHTAWLSLCSCPDPSLVYWEAPGDCALIVRHDVKRLQDLDLGRVEAEPGEDKILSFGPGPAPKNRSAEIWVSASSDSLTQNNGKSNCSRTIC